MLTTSTIITQRRLSMKSSRARGAVVGAETKARASPMIDGGINNRIRAAGAGCSPWT
jgi:hypothetical protein